MSESRSLLRHQSDFDDRLPKEFTATPSSGQTVFVLAEEPIATNIVFEVNEIPYGSNFFTVGPPNNTTITWLDTPFSLDSTDFVRIIYYPAN